MAAKYLHSLADENPDLQKQIGCVTGVFQIFNRHHIVSRRRVFSHSPKRGDSGSLLFNNGTPQRESTGSSKDSSASRLMKTQNVDLRDVVKDSMYREARGLSHNIVTKKESNNWYHDEPRELLRSKSCHFRDRIPPSVCKDFPRFSYDGRETDRLSIKPDSKTTNPKQLKELPRLSLDSKQRSIHALSLVPIKPSDSKSNLSRNPKTNCGDDADKDTSQTRPSGVVAKLMGLETFPLLNSLDDCGPIIETSNSKISLKKPKPISRVPIEPAPWKQRDGARAMTSSTKILGPESNVYSEVDKRLKNLEFAESGRNLRALKQILDAMQAVEARKDERQETMDISSGHESHIVIMKPSKLVKKGFANDKTGKDLINERTLRDSSKPRKHSNKQRSESKPQSGNRKPSNFKKTDDKKRETKMIQQVNKYEYCEESNSRQSSSSTPEKTTLPVKAGEPLIPEYPSPVSVLDDLVYVDDSPSPVKHISITKKDDATEKTVKDRCEATNDIQSNTISGVSFQTNREKLKKVENLVQKLKNLNSSHNESNTDYIASICGNTNPNDRYISQIFLASGLLLRDLKSFNLHASGYPINPELFLVLEHTKFSNLQKEKVHRKLIFDAVNEILIGKLSSGSGMIMQDPRKLLRELCLEIEQIQARKKIDPCGIGNEDDLKSILWEDVFKKSETWTGFYGESLVIAMEVERLILMDLVNEVVMGDCWF